MRSIRPVRDDELDPIEIGKQVEGSEDERFVQPRRAGRREVMEYSASIAQPQADAKSRRRDGKSSRCRERTQQALSFARELRRFRWSARWRRNSHAWVKGPARWRDPGVAIGLPAKSPSVSAQSVLIPHGLAATRALAPQIGSGKIDQLVAAAAHHRLHHV
jgi:hypothetical protein